ncbi:MAG: nucleotidyltransferase substrate binding protein [Cyclobacterium sp.]|uniref:nucleotidyltransferase substrate binding protein n=1 Tax=unclassified Cyclobacterium TaxID=2615055 RepID=UPI0013D31844|nr:nucleotidyltransferase substrate binding protein [Cyclobacterium sp. SYSU L10401]
MENDVRWKQRFSNFRKALKQLEAAVRLANTRELSQLEKQGLIQSFEYTHELAWLVMKDFFFYQGNPEIRGSRDATREAFKNGLIEDGEIWMDMIKSRNMSSHTYNEEIAAEIAQKITAQYFKGFADFMAKMGKIDLEKL